VANCSHRAFQASFIFTISICSGVGWAVSPPRMRMIGSPGRRWIEKNRIVAT